MDVVVLSNYLCEQESGTFAPKIETNYEEIKSQTNIHLCISNCLNLGACSTICINLNWNFSLYFSKNYSLLPQVRYDITYPWFQILSMLSQKDHWSSEIQNQPRQRGKTPFMKGLKEGRKERRGGL